MSNLHERAGGAGAATGPAAAAAAASSGRTTSPGNPAATTASEGNGNGNVSPQQGGVASTSAATSAPSAPSEEHGSRTRRGLERLSGLKDLGFEVLSRRQRHERDKSNSSARSSGPKSPAAEAAFANAAASKPSPPHTRTNTATSDGDLRSPGSTATAMTPASVAATSPPPPGGVNERRPPPSASSTSSSNAFSHRPVASSSGSQSTVSGVPSGSNQKKKPTFVLVTQDNESLAKVDIANLKSSAAIRERLFTKAHIPDDDFRDCTLHLTSLDQSGDPGLALDDSEIWQICQGVISGEMNPAPLFYVRRAARPHSASSPEYPSSPYAQPAGHSPFGDHAAVLAAASGTATRPDSRHETSSNSSVSAGRRPPSRSRYTRSNTAEQQPPASPLRTEQQQQHHSPYYDQQHFTPSQTPHHQSHHMSPPQPTHPAYHESDRRSSAGSGYGQDSLHPNVDYYDYSQQQQQQAPHYNRRQQDWERRSSAGASEHSDRPEWLEHPSNLRRQARQSHSESAGRPVWDGPAFYQDPSQQQQQQQGPPRPPVSVQQVGMGPSGPIYRTVATESSRPRANSASGGGDPSQPSQRYMNQQSVKQAAPPMSQRSQQAPPSFGPSGPLHFPQPSHHTPTPPPVPSTSNYAGGQAPMRRTTPTGIPEHHTTHLMPGSLRGAPPLNQARSMSDLRNGPSLPVRGVNQQPPPRSRMAPSPTGTPGAYQTDFSQQPSQRQQYFEDPRYAPAMRPAMSDTARPMSQIISPRTAQLSQFSPPPTHPQARKPPTNISPRIPSYPPAVQRLPPPQHPASYNAGPSRSAPSNALPGAPRQPQQQQPQSQSASFATRRPSFEQLQRPPQVTTNMVSGPQRIPLHPGETLQEVLHSHIPQPVSHRGPGHLNHVPAPRHAHTALEHAGPAYGRHSPAIRAQSYEERPMYAAQEVHSRSPHPQQLSHSQPQFVGANSFTASPPLQSAESAPQGTYGRYEYDDRVGGDSSRRAVSPSTHRQQYFEVHSARPSSEASVERPRSPASSRPSTSSDGHTHDRDQHRPHSYSSGSTNELSTPASDKAQDRSKRLQPNEHSPSHPLSRESTVPHVVDQDSVYEGVEMLRESIDAATIDDSDKPQQQYSSRPVSSSKQGLYLDTIEEATDTMKPSEWADMLIRMHDQGGDEDTLGKAVKRLSAEKSDEESSTLGKTTLKSVSVNQRSEKADHSVSPPAKAPASQSTKFTVPAPAVSYDPDEDDDDEVMTWAVQMKPTKPKGESQSGSHNGTPDTVMESSKSRVQPPDSIPLPPAGFAESANASPRLEKPSLRLQTDRLAPNGTPLAKGASQASASVAGSASGRPDTANSSISRAFGSDSKKSASPRSASRRHRQQTKDPAADDASSSAVSATQRDPPPTTADDEEGTNVSRRLSFSTNAWAYRPPVEQVYENLEEFFPGHDLDKPIIDAGVSASNSGVSSPAHEITSFASPTQAKAVTDTDTDSSTIGPMTKEPEVLHPRKEKEHHKHKEKEKDGDSDNMRKFNQNRKSMRMVAQDRKLRMRREETLTKAAAMSPTTKEDSKLARRKSTKVWGRKIEEVTAAEADLLHSARTEGSDRDERKCETFFNSEQYAKVFERAVAPIKWVKGELIGKGTYGHVYIGFNVTNGEMIAVKQVELPRTASDKEDNRQLSVIEALKSEMELLKDLEHEKIVSYLGFEETPAHLSILLEYVPGGSVGRCLRKHGKFQEEVIQFFTTQILEGLEYLHARGILHRDLKADNILVKMDGTIKISDFGISKRSNDIYNNNSNMSMQGSIFWMAPEVVHNQRKGYSAKIDIWSLGCVVLEMFAGRRPWDSEEAIQAMFKLGAERLAPPVPKDVHLTNQASHFLKECFHGEADRRPTASRLLCHKFLTLNKNWDFRTSSLAKAMSA